MPIRVTTAEDVRKRYAPSRASSVSSMSEFIDLRTKLANGLKRAEAVVVEFEPDPRNKNLRASFKRAVKKHLRKLNLTDYSVRALRDTSSGNDVVIVLNEEPVTSIRKRG